MEEKKYQIVMCDPPWKYNDKRGQSTDYGSAEAHYPTMTLDALKNIKVPAADDCALFMWATMPMLPEALELINSWGFSYRTCAFVWIKTTGSTRHYFQGLGSWTASNAELCLLGTKGNIKRHRELKHGSEGVSQIIEAPVTKHSKKPNEVRKRIVKLMGDLPRIELFAREQADGWAVFGNDPNLTKQEKLNK